MVDQVAKQKDSLKASSDPSDVDRSPRHSRPGLKDYTSTRELQSARRARYLEQQRQARADSIRIIRNLSSISTLVESDESNDDMDGKEDEDKEMGTGREGLEQGKSRDSKMNQPRRRRRKSSKSSRLNLPRPSFQSHIRKELMQAELMDEVPGDLTTEWLLIGLPPKGTRCLVIAYKDGIYQKEGTPPTLYLLDLMCWRGQSFYDCDTDMRYFWLTSRWEEWRQEYKTAVPQTLGCHVSVLTKTRATQGEIQQYAQDPTVDSLLFQCRASHYHRGVTPLCLWLSKDDVSRVIAQGAEDMMEEEVVDEIME
ncbi:MAG: hypothetical protein DHS80DRAFT_24862 [Piptocephalis tieghemiana]|nr:MAG: hypothetical protein DHS80DRAFT_24862 [Piptocephalis tieghemiana]